MIHVTIEIVDIKSFEKYVFCLILWSFLFTNQVVFSYFEVKKLNYCCEIIIILINQMLEMSCFRLSSITISI